MIMKTQNWWIVNGRTGISSRTMWAALNDAYDQESGASYDIPHDAADFGRCYRYVEATGLSLEDIQQVGEIIPWWKPITDEWESLCELYLDPQENAIDNDERLGTSMLYSRLKQLGDVCREIRKSQKQPS